MNASQDETSAGNVGRMNSSLYTLPRNDQSQVPLSLAGAAGEATAAVAATVTLTEQEERPPQDDDVLILTLRSRPSVTWDENVVDNEGLGRKSSKRCCIFHKQRSFGESSTDSSDYDSDRSGSSKGSVGAGDDGDKKMRPKKHKKKIARPKKEKKVPDYQRFHA